MPKLITFLALLVGLVFSAFPAFADSNSNYIANVEIDVTAASAAAAREKGMNEAYRNAFLTVSERLTNSEGLSRLSKLTDSQLLNFIKEATVISEKASDVRYIATLKININSDLLKTYMQEQGIPFALKSSANILIIPVFREFSADSPLLWEKNNLWRQAWENTPITDSSNTYISLPSTGNNYSAIDGEQALRLDGIALDKIARNMGTSNIYILDATYNGIEGLKVTIIPYNGNSQHSLLINGDRSPELFSRAIPAITKYIDSTLRNQVLSTNNQPKEMIVLYNYSTLGDWVKTEKKIKSMNNVSQLNVDAIGKGKVQFRITYLGDIEDFSTALRLKSLELKNFEGFYTIENTLNQI